MSRDVADDWFPLDPDEHARQVGALQARLMLLRGRDAWAIDVGAGAGRLAKPAAEAGVRILAIDNDAEALRLCAGEGIETRCVDALDPSADLSLGGAPAAAAWCMGHTFMLFHEPAAAAGLMRRLRGVVAPGGWFAIDAFCKPLWADVAEGLWQTGVSEDGEWQLVWAPGDNVLALRRGKEIRKRDWSIRPGDRLMRLWSMGELALLAEASGWGAPREDESGALVIFTRPER